MAKAQANAWCDGLVASDLVAYSQDLGELDRSGRWAVVVEFDGTAHLFRFRSWEPGRCSDIAKRWRGPTVSSYITTLSQAEYEARVGAIRESISRGWLYQANLCRVMSAPLPDSAQSDIFGLAALLHAQNPAPFAFAARIPEHGIEVACASPELYFSRAGRVVESGPIKGTAAHVSGLTEKDRAENVMIADLVRNDLSQVCVAGSVHVPRLLRVEHHPGVVHLVSRVAGVLEQGTSWQQILGATFPPGSVSGAPKYSALQTIGELEPTARGPYCGAIGWVDADRNEARLAVGIRTFWKTYDVGREMVNFGTGAGITWGSDPRSEWEETELKARHLTRVAAGEWE